MELLRILGISLGMTEALELPFAAFMGLRKKDLLLTVFVNLMTNPAVVLVYYLAVWKVPVMNEAAQNVLKVLLEAAAVAAEGWYYKKYAEDIKKPYGFSVLANGFSFTMGYLMGK